jgi:hypothetical protein
MQTWKIRPKKSKARGRALIGVLPSCAGRKWRRGSDFTHDKSFKEHAFVDLRLGNEPMNLQICELQTNKKIASQPLLPYI